MLKEKKPSKLGKAGKAATFTYQETEAQAIMRTALDTTVSMWKTRRKGTTAH